MTTYEEALNMINSMKPITPTLIDINEMLNKRININTIDYNSALSLLNVQQIKTKPIQIVKEEIPTQTKEKQIQQQTKPQTQKEETKVPIKEEIEKIEGVSNIVERQIIKRKIKDLVLPTLSIQDQISELEKIKEGLDEKVFNEEQISIIKEEVSGLELSIKIESPTADSFVKGLRDMRGRLLNDVINKLREMYGTAE